MDLQNILGAHNDTLNFLVFTKNQKKTQKIQEKTLFLDYITQHRFLSVLVNHTTPKLFFSKSRKSQLSNDVFKIVMRPLEKILFHFLWKKFHSAFLWLFPLHPWGLCFGNSSMSFWVWKSFFLLDCRSVLMVSVVQCFP